MSKIVLTWLFWSLVGITTAWAQALGTIKGSVRDEAGQPLPGANVVVEHTTIGAATDADGRFVLRLSPGVYTLVASFVGYEPARVSDVQVRAGDTTEVTFVLQPTVLRGAEVVVIGYGEQEKRDVTGAVVTVRPSEITELATTQPAEMLQGMAPGVDVAYATGAPGAAPDIKIRGAGSFNNNYPLIVVDGIPSSLSYVNPADIEAIDIIKDASMAAIYGARAANGVIFIRTRRGHSGEPIIQYSSYYSYDVIPKKFPFITRADEYVRVAKMALDNAGVPYFGFVTEYDQNPERFANSDWQEAYFRSGYETKHDLSISGGTEQGRFSVSGMYARQNGIVINTYNERMSLRLNSDFEKGKFKFGESFSIGRSKGNSRWNEAYNFYHLSRMSPLTPIYDSDNPSGYGSQYEIEGLSKDPNIILEQELNKLHWDWIRAMISGYITFEPWSGVKYTLRLGGNIASGYNMNYFPEYFSNEADFRPFTSMNETRQRSYHTIIENFINVNKTFDAHKVELLLGTAREQTGWRSTYGYVKEFPSTELRVLGAGEEGDDASGWASDWRMLSFFGRVSYAFRQRYMITANLRRDGSSRFDPKHRWGWFPSFSVAWRLSDEPFLRNVSWLSELKLRGGYGELGMQEFEDYAFIPKIEKDINGWTNYAFGPGRDQVIFIGARNLSFPSIGIHWETSKETNIGLDAGLFADALSLTMDYYVRRSEGILYAVPIPPSAGSASNPTVNSASVKNTGFELGLTYRGRRGDLRYQIVTNMSTFHNVVEKLGRTGNEAIWGGEIHWSMDPTTKTVVGKPIGAFFLYKTDGIFRSQEEIDNYVDKNGNKIQPDAKPGDVKYVDVNGDGQITEDDKVFMGDGTPDVTLGLGLHASYKNFDLTINAYAELGKKMINGARWLTMRVDKFHGMHRDLLKAWTPENPDSNIPRVIYGDDRNTLASDLWLEDASYLRIRHIELGYTLPANFTMQYGLAKFRVYVAAENLITLTRYTGYDPAITYGTLFSRGADRSPYPLSRKYLVGVQVVF